LSEALYSLNSAPFSGSLSSPSFVNSILPLIFVFDTLSGSAFTDFLFSFTVAFSTLSSDNCTYPSGALLSFITYSPYSTFLNLTNPSLSLTAVDIGLSNSVSDFL